MRPKKNFKKLKITLGILGGIIACGIICLFIFANSAINHFFEMVNFDDIEVESNENLSEETVLSLKGKMTVALFGLDNRNDDLKHGNSDVIMIATIDNDTGEVKICSVYRDTCMKVGKKYAKINSAYATGSATEALNSLNQNLDLSISEYTAFNWTAVATAINLLGGVDVDIDKDEFKYINGYITETVNSTGIGSVHIEAPGLNHLDGVQAVAYARIRYTAGNDFKRTERQRLILSLMTEKAKKADLATLNSIAEQVLPLISTSLDKNEIMSLVINLTKYNITETSGFPFEKTTGMLNGGDYVFAEPFADNVIELHHFLYNDANYSPSDAIYEISDAIQAKRGKGSKNASQSVTQPAATAPTQPETLSPENESVTEENESIIIEGVDGGPGVSGPLPQPTEADSETVQAETTPLEPAIEAENPIADNE